MRFTTNYIANILIGIILLISSFDVFLNLRVVGFSLRIIFLFITLLIFLYLIHQIKSNFKIKIKLLGALSFFAWIFSILIFIPHTTILSRNIGYAVWLILLALFIIILPSFVKDREAFLKLIKWYLITFMLIALFGILQFVLGLAGISLLITQYWSGGSIPRINAFSYEPSYFSTYMLTCWVMCFYLIIKKSRLATYFRIKIIFMISTVVLILSTSRMGLLFMVLIIVIFSLKSLKSAVLYMKVKTHEAYILVPFFLFIGLVTLYSIFNFEKVYFMFNGLGIFGTAAHSSGARISEFGDTLRAFWKSPIIGYSLGGIPSAIAEIRGFMITTQFQAKSFEGMNVFAEVLAASGIIGFIFFMSFLIQLFRKSYQLSKVLKEVDNSFANLIKALLLSLFFELLILNMNQNILRPYLWVHIGIINLSYIIGKQVLEKYKLTQKAIEDVNH